MSDPVGFALNTDSTTCSRSFLKSWECLDIEMCQLREGQAVGRESETRMFPRSN